MTAIPSPRTRFAVRCLAVLLASALLGAAVAGLSAARAPDAPAKAPDKPPRPPEDEDPDAKPITHKVTVDEPDDAAKTTAAPRAVDLAQAARDAKHEALKSLFRDLAVPHDVVKLDESAGNQQINIVPIPDYIADHPDTIAEPFQVKPFPRTSWTPGDPKALKKNTVVSVTPYEKLAETAVDELFNGKWEENPDPKKFLSRFDQDVAAEQALTTVLLRLQSDRKREVRKGDAWQAVEDSLKQKLLGVLLEKRDALVQAKDWNGAFDLTKQLAGSYRGTKDQERIAAPLAVQVRQTLTMSLDEKAKAEARRRLVQLQDLFPDNAAIQPVVADLHKLAQDLLDEAQKEMKGPNNPDRVGRLLTEAAEAWPGAPDLQAVRTQLNKEHPILRVGVRELPAQMSPTRAVTDSDRRAVELLFESLMKLSPDGAGGSRWEPSLVEGRPGMVPRGRTFQLPANACWSNGERITVEDVHQTVGLIRKGQMPGRPPVWGDLFDDVSSVNDQSHLKFTLTQGWLDPLALMNFKVLPSGQDPNAPAFAQHPLGSGPFVYEPNLRTDYDRPCVTFLANSTYGARPGHTGLPRIEQIRFIAYKGDPVDQLAPKPGRLNLILDLTAKEAEALKAKANSLKFTVTGPSSPNRRIWFLAVNHRKPALANAAFRMALALAIHRDKLLDDDFRAAPGQNLHAPLNGPYPVQSWAADPTLVKKHGDKATFDPFDAELARAKKTDSGVADAPLSLKYPAGDDMVGKAMADLAAQVKEAIGVTLRPEGVAPADLRKDVEETHAYDLAYYHYDFPDDVYWLGPLLDPRGGPAGENYLGYPGDEKGSLLPMMVDASRRRDFAQVRDWTHELHKTFLNTEMPFIPLWQLDPLAAVGAEVTLPPSEPPFDPLLVFTDVEGWKLK